MDKVWFIIVALRVCLLISGLTSKKEGGGGGGGGGGVMTEQSTIKHWVQHTNSFIETLHQYLVYFLL